MVNQQIFGYVTPSDDEKAAGQRRQAAEQRNVAAPVRKLFMGPERDAIGIAMLCAWNNIPVEMAHPDWSSHANESTRDAWVRVYEAVIAFGKEKAPEA